MTAKTVIANITLGRIGVSKQLSNVDTDTAFEAQQIRTFFDDAVAFTLRDFHWPFATSYVTLALVGGSTTPVNYDWQYSYRYPSDCVNARRIVTPVGRRNPNPPAFAIGRDATGKLIFTDQSEAQLEYTKLITSVEEFDPIFVSALAWKIGADAAPGLSRIPNMAKVAMSMFEIDISKARARAANESQQDPEEEAEMTRARE